MKCQYAKLKVVTSSENQVSCIRERAQRRKHRNRQERYIRVVIKGNDMTYKIEFTENQFKTVQRALEMWERMMMGQFMDFADELALNGYRYDKSDPDNDEKFNKYIDRRNESQELMEKAYRAACPVSQNKTYDMLTIEDIWVAMRYQMWQDRPEPKPHDTVDSRKPFGVSDEPIPKIERLK